ncbi:MAG TPA: asparagine synthase-related protein [Thermoleophilaceae bacterium]
MEVLANLLLGPDGDAPPLPAAEGIGVHAALERAVLRALRRPPCLVSFSGGRDSSAILAVAAAAARRHGLPDPVPAIMRFPDAPETDEAAWQELALSHVGIREPAVIELRDELDALGPAATAALRRGGVRWPGNAHMHAPILERARGGSLLTGIGGDELLGTTASRHVLLARRRARPRRRDAASVALAALPRPVRAAVWRRRGAPPHPWLTPAGAALVARALAREEVSWPHRWDRSVGHWHRSRAYAALDGALAALAVEHDVAVVNPFLDPVVLAELAVAGGSTGFPSRTDAMRTLFGDLLPAELVARPGKAAFPGALWGPAVREFAAAWGGEGVDRELADVDALRREWLAAEPDFRTILLLHAAWLRTEGSGAPRAPGR